jgi:hypothetical protein
VGVWAGVFFLTVSVRFGVILGKSGLLPTPLLSPQRRFPRLMFSAVFTVWWKQAPN